MDQIGGMLPLILMFGVLYLLILRPQMKKQKLMQKMLSELQKGDKVIVGGIHGKITATPNEKSHVKVSIANNVEISVERSAITGKIDKNADEAKIKK